MTLMLGVKGGKPDNKPEVNKDPVIYIYIA